MRDGVARMFLLSSLKDDIVALTHCKLKGHTVSGLAMRSLGEHSPVETSCAKCRWPIVVYIDPDDPKYCLVSEAE